MSKEKTKTVSKAKKIYNIVSTAIVAVVFIFLIVVVGLILWQRKSGGDSSLFGHYMFEVLTDSMSGTIESGEVILAKKVDDPSALKEGDIITFIAPSGPLRGYNETHRIVEVARNEDGSVLYFRTKGDNEEQADGWQLNPSDVKAKFVRKSPFIAGFRRFLSHWYGYFVLIALPLIIVGVLLIVGYVKERAESGTAAELEKDRPSLDSMSEKERKRLYEEYLAHQSGSNKSDSDSSKK